MINKTSLIRAIQIILTSGLLLWLSATTDWSSLEKTARSANWNWLFIAILCVLFSHLINTLRWKLLIPPRCLSFAVILSYYGAGIFSNNFLPTGIGGDGIRAALLSKHLSFWQAIWSVTLDRILGLLGLLIFIVPGLALGLPPLAKDIFNSMSSERLKILTHIFLLTGMIILILIWKRDSDIIRSWIQNYRSKLIPNSVTIQELARTERLRLILASYGLSVLSALFLVLAHASTLCALTLYYAPEMAIWLVIGGSLTLLIPISINGLGAMEGAYVLILTSYGVPMAGALSVALIIRFLIIFYSLLGGVLSLRLRWWDTSIAKPTG
ncbi:MAG: lysylphosphatidylglycerol synthase transmembrane domain-containing protein [Oscillochloridaceae bacterium]|nr:flippase-like domain-containing protein [Chloroflexaceae bacterium]MDW8391091.1 lysylphosphatidylglycerol synthase transmembrane domain-containing protein [Oscillochloridaceae bacterium]